MSNLTYDQQDQLKSTRQINREAQRYFGEKEGDAEKFKKQIDEFRTSNGFKPMYGKELKK